MDFLREDVNIDEVEEVALGALDLFLEAVHDLVLDVEHVLPEVDHLLGAFGRSKCKCLFIIVFIFFYNYWYRVKIFEHLKY